MSGVEIAGLVLATFSIVIEGLENYRNIARRMESFHNAQSKYLSTIDSLDYHRLVFKANLEQVLFSLVDESQLQDLIANPGGPGWNDPGIQQALERRLHKSYDLYLKTLSAMQQTMQELNKELSVDNLQLQSQIANRVGAIYSLYYADSDCYPSRVQANIDYSQSRSAPSQPSNPSKLRDSISRSTIEFQLFRIKFSLGETTRIRLFSELKTYNERLEKLALISKQSIDLRANHDIDASKSATQQRTGVETGERSRRSVRLRMHEEKQAKALTLLSPKESTSDAAISLSIPQHRSRYLIRPAFYRGKRTKTVRFLYPKVTQSVSQGGNTIPLTTYPTQEPTVSTENIVDNLCATLMKCSDDIRYRLTPKQRPAIHTIICLSEILSDAAPFLTRRQRFRLSVEIASSFVQLEDTAWPHISLGKDSVYLSRTGDENTLRLESPLIVQSFASRSPTTSQEPRDHISSLASLGILLLELCFGRSIDQHPSRLRYPNGDKQTNAAFDLVTALEWVRDVNDDAGGDYYEAIEWCLYGCRILPTDRGWKKLMVEKVVVPLERCCQYLDI
ncbi:hypothetical protein GGR51DRAFT_566791 [Nemania sp. FL0031]|nr:hypothetical protein GGR51DRAFT_566791 [Nemania sp. FL0031]